ncbi:hypothetical protein BDB01DRAFT_850966 [Pilobolus umbonatus]|nr:hypothetical protein BDB01DRAFT_850966 [Pilobolus umbonatus]
MTRNNKRQRTSYNSNSNNNSSSTDKEYIQRLEQMLQKVTEERDLLREENNNLVTENKSLKIELKYTKLSLVVKKDKVEELEKEKMALETDNSKCHSYIKKLKTDVECFVQLEDTAREEVRGKEKKLKESRGKFKSIRMDCQKLKDIIKDKDERIEFLMNGPNPSRGLMLSLGDQVEKMENEKKETDKYHQFLWEVLRKKDAEIERLTTR